MSAGRSATARLTAMLRTLHQDAERAHGPITYAQMIRASEAGRSTIGGWLSKRPEGRTAPTAENHPKYRTLVAYLAGKAGVRLDWHAWELAISEATAEGRRNQRAGRPPNEPRRPRVTRFHHEHTAKGLRPAVLLDREAELGQLAHLVRTRSGYLALNAGPWSGKTALLATFVARHAPDIDVDLVSYFVRRGQETDHAQAFLSAMVTVLGRHTGRRRPTADRTTLFELWEEAARTSGSRGRKLLVVVDGLDEDAGARPGGQSIAALLPKQTYPELLVLVGTRWHPPLPTDVDADHPLRGAEKIPGFRPSPHALVLRDLAAVDLDALIDEPQGWGWQVIGYLLVARGGLSCGDLTELIGLDPAVAAPLPRVLQRTLYNVAGRGLDLQDLEPDSLILAHEQLYAAAEAALGKSKAAVVTARLHTWAEHYRAQGWPESTPAYLLHSYQELLRHTGDFERYTIFTLDHRRLLRLADRGHTDLALTSLDHLTAMPQTPAVLAAAATSRALLTSGNQILPREVVRALVLVGDTTRARSLALSPLDPASKALRLTIVVHALLATRTPAATAQAQDCAREAARWAERAAFQDYPVASTTAEPDTQAIMPRTAVALAAAGLADEAVDLLTTVDISKGAHAAVVAEAAALLASPRPDFAAWLLQELTLEADYQADADDGRPDLAVEIWAAVAAADPSRSAAVHDTMRHFVAQLATTSPGLRAVDCQALAASALAPTRPAEARELAASARHMVRDLMDTTPQDALGETLARVVQALLDVGDPPAQIRTLTAEAPAEAALRPRHLLDDLSNEDNEGQAAPEAAGTTAAQKTATLIKDMSRLSDLADGPRLRHILDQFLASTTTTVTAPWVPFLSQALTSTWADPGESLDRLLAGVPDPLLQVQALTWAALAAADTHRRHDAWRYADKAARIARHIKGTPPPAVRALVAQAFAHAQDTQQARAWAAPAGGRRPLGQAGILYRRATLAVDMGLQPHLNLAHVLDGDHSTRLGLSKAGADLVRTLLDHAAQKRTNAQLAEQITTAHARLHTEPLLATGLALLHAFLGDTQRARGTIEKLPDPATYGMALTAVAAYVAGIPAHLDIAADGDDWTLSVLRTLAHHLRAAKAGPTDNALARRMATNALATSTWYQALPVLAHTTPKAINSVINVLDHHRAQRTTPPPHSPGAADIHKAPPPPHRPPPR